MKNIDLLGFEIIGLKEAKTDSEKLIAFENHKELLKGLVREAISTINEEISTIKYKNEKKTIKPNNRPTRGN